MFSVLAFYLKFWGFVECWAFTVFQIHGIGVLVFHNFGIGIRGFLGGDSRVFDRNTGFFIWGITIMRGVFFLGGGVILVWGGAPRGGGGFSGVPIILGVFAGVGGVFVGCSFWVVVLWGLGTSMIFSNYLRFFLV